MPQRRQLLGAMGLSLLAACTPAGGPGPVVSGSANPASPTPAPPQPSPTPPSPTPPSPTPPSPTPPAPDLPAALRGQDFTRIPTTEKVCALTFDAGANANGLASILATLRDRDVAASFFLTGGFTDAFPNEAAKLTGYRLGNHSMTHPHLPALTDAQVRAEVRDAEARIRAATGSDPRPFFRFPYGDRDSRTIGLINSLGYMGVRWTVDSLGWQGTGSHTAASVAQRVLDTAQPGQIVLMHVGSNPQDGSTLDADALPAIVDGLRAKGYRFVTLDEFR